MADAIGTELVSKIVGYMIAKGNFQNKTSNLPQRIAILGEANTANQGTLDLTPKEILSAQQAGQLYGFGSPIHMAMRILKPISGPGVGGIPVVVYPQAEADGAARRVVSITPTGVATANGTHYVKIAGRRGLDGVFYAINILKDDTTDDITAKIEDAVNNVLGCPFTGTSTDYEATLTAKWAGLTSQGLNVTVDVNNNDLGITYVVNEENAGSGTPSISDALDMFGEDWNTIVINTYGAEDTIMETLEAFNGRPDPENPTGRYAGIVMKPFFALTGSTLDDPTAITDTRKDDCTIVVCPAPLSPAHELEAAANYAALLARQAQDSPHLDISGQSLPDMPLPENGDIPAMTSYDVRDSYVKKGCSTVEISSGRYKVADFVTTYHPVGETPPQFRYVRNLVIDFNIRFRYYVLEQLYVVDHLIANDDDAVTASKVIKPKSWKAILYSLSDDLVSAGLTVESTFTQESITVAISDGNPDRLNTFFRYKRSGFARQSSTVGEAGFNFGTQN